MDLLKQKIAQIAKETSERNNLFLIDLILRGNESKRIIEVYIDGEVIVTADTLAAVSREIDDRIYKEELISGSYRLDVSTPGVERPLKYLQQYFKHIGRKMQMKVNLNGGEKEFTGKLLRIEESNLFFDIENVESLVKFEQIISAKVIISFR
jgi:ribosome maturation factor RimP